MDRTLVLSEREASLVAMLVRREEQAAQASIALLADLQTIQQKLAAQNPLAKTGLRDIEQ